MKTTAFANDLQELIYNGTAIADLAENDSAAPATDLYYSLHATWPGLAASQSTGEVAYTSYARAAMARDGTDHPVTGNSVSPGSAVAFPACTGGSATAYFWGLGTGASGAGYLMEWGAIGAAPTLVTGATSDTITSPAHGLAADDPLVFWKVFGATLPAGITEGTVYFAKTVPGVDTFTIAATVGGSTLDITASGVGAVQKLTPGAISNGVTPSLTTALTIKEF